MPDSLRERIIRHIELSGPLPLAEFMHWCIADRQDGYYLAEKSIGSDGDFITAPEVSQMFGELIGIWALQTWHDIGCPKQFNLVELGPGRGTLMRDLLRAVKVSQPFMDAADVKLVETSPRLVEEQSATLAGSADVSWVENIEELTGNPTIVIANEFLDVLPVRQYVKTGSKWCENCVGTDENGDLAWVLGPGQIHQSLLPKGHERNRRMQFSRFQQRGKP